MKNVRYILRLTVILFVITAAVAAALAGVNAITKDRIAQAQVRKTQKAIALVLPDAVGLEEMALAGDAGMVKAVYANGASYAVEVEPSGFGGAITMMVGVEKGAVTGISIISHGETPGLGAIAAADNAKGEAFRSAFVGEGPFAVGENVDAISGATITSKAVAEGVNAALDYLKEVA